MALTICLYSAALLAITWAIAHATLIPRPISGIPYNKLSSFAPWGDLADLGIYNWRTGEVFSWLSLQCLKHTSPLVQVFMPPFSMTHPTLVIADISEIEHIVTKRGAEIDRADIMHIWFGYLVPKATIGLKSKDRQFKEQRRLWSVVLSPKFLQDIAGEALWEATNDLCTLWDAKASIAGPECFFEAQTDVRMATLDGMWRMCVGTRLGMLDARIAAARCHGLLKRQSSNEAKFDGGMAPAFYHALERLLLCMDWIMQGISPYGYALLFRVTQYASWATRTKDEVLDECIATAKERATNRFSRPSCALDEVYEKARKLRTEDSGPSQAVDDAEIRDELLELLITGHETTASSIAWALKYLTDNPDVQERLRASLYLAFPNATPSEPPCAKDIMTEVLSYLDAVVAETLRISATGPVSFRQTIAPCQIMGHDIPAGTPLILVTAGPSYDDVSLTSEKSAKSPASVQGFSSPMHATHHALPRSMFCPERWLKNGEFDPQAVHMLPFSAGSRGCFGKKIALLELRIVLTVLILKFRFPKLAPAFSRYGAWDGLTRRSTCCFVQPTPIKSRPC